MPLPKDPIKAAEWKRKRKLWSTNKGRKFSEEWRKNLSLAHKGQHSSPSTEFKKGQNSGEKCHL